MYQLKQVPNDFIVEEITNLNLDSIKSQTTGKYLIIFLKKEDITQQLALHIIAKELNISQKHIGVAGTKDKVAITTQYISIKTQGKANLIKEKITSFSHENISLTTIGQSNEPLSLGDLKGNMFTITIKNLTVVQIDSIKSKTNSSQKENTKQRESLFYLNYFDEQRFQKHNSAIGKHLIKKQWNQAANLIQNHKVKEQLVAEPSQPLKAIKILNKRELMMYLHAYQSYIFNETLKRFIQKNTNKASQKIQEYSLGELMFTNQEELQKISTNNQDNLHIPLPGFLKPKSKNKEINLIQSEILKEEKIKHNDFIIKQLSNLSPEGDLRQSIKQANNFKILTKTQEVKNTQLKIQFSLEKGSYATMFIKQLLN